MNIIRRSLFNFSANKFNASKDYYKILGVKLSSDEKQIKTAFRKLAKQYHPDSTTGNEEKFKEVNEAYQVLSVSQLKKEYDETRNYSQSNKSYNPNSGQSGYSQSNYANSQYNYNQNYHQNYQHPSQSNQYRGYTRDNGWQNQKYREQVMNEIFKQYQKNRSQYGSFEDMYKSNQQHVRQYTDQMKRRQEAIRKAFEAQEMRKEKMWREYQEQQIKDIETKLTQKMGNMKEGFVKNINGVFKVGSFLKDTFKNVAETVVKSVSKDNKNDKNNKK